MNRIIRRSLLCMLALTVIFLWLYMFFTPRMFWFRAPTGRCVTNIAKLGTAISDYARDHGGALPSSLSALAEYRHDPSVFICPATDHTPGEISDVDVWSDYAFCTDMGADSAGRRPLIRCRVNAHGTKTPVLWNDKHLTLMDREQLEDLFTNKILQHHGGQILSEALVISPTNESSP